MDEIRATKLWLQKQFKTNGVQCQPAALERLIDVVQDVPDPESFVHSLLEEVLAGRVRHAPAGSRDRADHAGSALHHVV